MSANGRAKVSALPLNLNSDLPVRLSAACPLTGGWSPVYRVSGRQDNAFTPLSKVNVRVMPKSIPQTIIEIRSDLLLVVPVPVQLTVMSPLRIRGTHPFHPGFLSKLSASLVSLITVGIHFVVSIN